MSKKIVVFGSIVQDLVSYTDRFPRPGESVRGIAFHAGEGGKGANQAVAAARLGGDAHLIAKVGDDMFGEGNKAGLKKGGVDTSSIGTSSTGCSTGTATITVSSDGENSIVVTLGANMELGADSARHNADLIKSSSLVICQCEVDPSGNRMAFQLAREAGVPTLFNPAPFDPEMDKSILELVDIIVVNENEAEFATSIPQSGSVAEAERAARALLTMGPTVAVVTLGGQGAVVASSENSHVTITHVPCPSVSVVDTTGAGDCFCGSLAYYLVDRKDLSLAESVRRAAFIAAQSVTKKGTQCSYSTRAELEKEFPEMFA